MRFETSRIGQSSFLAFLMGLVSSLYVSTPGGFVAMFDLAAYLFAIPLFFTSYPSYPRMFKRLLGFGVLWLVGEALSNFYRGTSLMVTFKASMILADSLCLLIVSAWILQKTPKAFAWFLIGTSISSVISLYHFQNGALLAYAVGAGYTGGEGMSSYLMDKQVKPLWVKMIIMGGVFALRMLIKLPWPICIASFSLGGAYLLINGGSRSTFLTMNCTAGIMALYVYAPRIFCMLFKKKMVTLFCVLVAAVLFNALYMSLAKSGVLGENGLAKYEAKKSGESSFLDNRNDIVVNWPYLWRSPIIGAGSELIDKEGYLAKGKTATYERDGTVRLLGHSCIIGAWCTSGILGLAFWVFVLWLMLDFLGRRCFLFGDVGPFVLYGLISMVWSILFSPYGGFRGQVMLTAAFLALAKDRRFDLWMQNAGLTFQEKRKYLPYLTKR